MKKKLLCSVMSLTLGMSLLVGCSSNSGADGDTIKIGGLVPLTGAASSYGQSVKNGALLPEFAGPSIATTLSLFTSLLKACIEELGSAWSSSNIN